MAEVHVVSSIYNIQNLMGDIEQLPISNELRKELTVCLKSIYGSDLHRTDSVSAETPSQLNEVVILLNRFAKVTLDVLKACELLRFPYTIICKTITDVVGIIFSGDLASVVIDRFTDILEADLIAKCRASCTKMVHCISYMQGFPAANQPQQDDSDKPQPKRDDSDKPLTEQDTPDKLLQNAADKLKEKENKKLLQLLVSDVPILIGLDEVLFLGEKIKDMVKIADLKKTNKLFEHAKLYCCLATFRELFLLYRLSIQSVLSVDIVSIRNVLDAQKKNDKEVLQFLYKPTKKTGSLFRYFSANQWPILGYFLQRRGLFPDNLSELNGKTFKIKSVINGGMIQTDDKMTNFLHLTHDANDATVHFELRGGTDNVFNIFAHHRKNLILVGHSSYVERLCLCIPSLLWPSAECSRWYLLKLQPESPGETPCYMIWLKSNYEKCLWASKNHWNCGVFFYSLDAGENHLWKLELVHNA